ncbi:MULTISPECIES: hypothetical protein [unclassified Rhodococcus (in: high G+C Gram-positive bacteria)]|uniref:hypothetical protein n=1 Tax=unclassified Rhodococcus (in: high G+C Gram-positive bacteria) TaxID=192944 RepID=UPI00295327C6|nr:hypothetical protein [Rhodococcus sp. IEGM 1343]MDV8055421.1 hypothetical protein [Rhodococcus sp. IEGM 1343]
MTIITDRPTAAGVRARSTVVERRRRARPVLRSPLGMHGVTTVPRTQSAPCLPVLDPSWTDVTDREDADREFDATSAHFASQPVRLRSLVLWMLAVVVVAGGLIGIANLRAVTPDAGVQPAGVVEVHDGALVEYTTGR